MVAQIDSAHFRRVMGRYPTGISMVAAQGADGSPIGMIVGTFGSVSMDPPLVSFMPAKTSTTWPLIEQAGSFSVNVLSVEQEAVCRAFRGDQASRFAGESWRTGVTGSPVLARAAAWVECEVESVLDAGDHFIVLGRVLALDSENTNLPMLFFQGGYGSFTPDTMVSAEVDIATHLAFVDRARPLMEALARDMGCECVLGAIERKKMLLLASAGTRADSQLSLLVGERLPTVAPIGRTAMAWAPEERAEEWMSGTKVTDRDSLEQALKSIRDRGYSITVENDGEPAGNETQPTEIIDPGVEQDSTQVVLSGRVQSVTAPIFSGNGEVEFVLGLFGIPDGWDESKVESAAAELQAVVKELQPYLRG